MIRKLKKTIETIEALEGRKDHALRRQFNELAGGNWFANDDGMWWNHIQKKHDKCRGMGKDIETCLKSPGATYHFVKNLDKKLVERLLTTLSIRLQTLKQREEFEKRRKAQVPAVANDVAPALTKDEKMLARIQRRKQNRTPPRMAKSASKKNERLRKRSLAKRITRPRLWWE